MADKRAIKVETLDRLGASFQESRGITDKLTIEEMIELAKVPTASGENKLAQLVDGTITEITAEDLEGATTIRADMFHNLPSLERITLPDTITEIGEWAFGASLNSYSPKIINIVFPNSITKLGNYQHQQNIYLQSVTFPQNAQFTHIPSSIFNGCSALDNVVIPNSVIQIGNSAFYYCTNLTNITLSKSLTNIGSGAFNYCSALTNLTIPASVKTIGSSNALNIGTNTNKATFTFLSTTPPTIDKTSFSVININKIIVPKGCGEAYKSATNWANFADYIEEATE